MKAVTRKNKKASGGEPGSYVGSSLTTKLGVTECPTGAGAGDLARALSLADPSLLRDAEAERYELLIEVAGLVVHDLSSPLYALMCATEILSSDPSKALRPDFCSTLKEATETAFELISTLKSYLRTPEAAADDQVLFGAAMDDARRVLKLRLMQPLSFQNARLVEIVVSPELRNLRLAISRADLMHVLMNILGNAYQAAQVGPSSAPLVRLDLGEGEAQAAGREEHRATILISDNGTGLSFERYQQMTGGDHQASSGGSMGLKLTRRLIERKGGCLSLLDRPVFPGGTTFEVTLPLVTVDKDG